MQYAAFISYAHADEAIARRVHNALETYSIPKNLDIESKDKLSPIFRDMTELSAHHSLGEKIVEAIRASRFLIVLCSPAAKFSFWVNEEIKLFRQIHGDSAIISVIVNGAPETSFPAALTADGREPMAANMNSREGFRFGITQIAAAMLGVGLDQLLQRDSQRRRRRLQVMTSAALVFAIIMGTMAWTAIDARDEAEISRSEAEKMSEFMIKDLQEDLDKIGRLDILENVGKRVTAYYDAIPLSDMDDDRLARQARARHILGKVAIKQGNEAAALQELGKGYSVTDEILRRAPDDPVAIYSHAQSAYWIGSIYKEKGQFAQALPYRITYNDLSKKLHELDPDNQDWAFEYGWAQNNLGVIYKRLQNYDLSEKHYKLALDVFNHELLKTPDNDDIQFEIAAISRNLAGTQVSNGKVKLAKSNYNQQIDVLSQLVKKNPHDRSYKAAVLLAKARLLETEIEKEKICPKPDDFLFLGDMEDMIELDPSNYIWFGRYISMLHLVLKDCSGEYDKNWIGSRLNTLETYDKLVEFPDQSRADAMKWLADYKSNFVNSE